MVPRIGDRGHSFKGAGLYYLHDKKADTNERVAWTHIHNIPTNDPEKAFKFMAYTAMNAERLKRQAGVRSSGRKASAGSVYSFSLAWHPEQSPDKQTMMDSAFQTLNLLKLQEHEAVFVAHNDRDHQHVHVICNLVHPETGKTAVISYDRLTMSAWAEHTEKKDGKVLCEQRVINNEKRRASRNYDRMFGMVKHQEQKLERTKIIQELYERSDNAKSFMAGLEQAGYTLAKGDRRGYVLVDRAGEIYSLSRQLTGQRAKDIKTRLQGITNLQEAKAIAAERKHFDRDKYETERQKKIVDEAVKNEQQRKAHDKKPEKESKAGPKPSTQTHNPFTEHLRKLDEQREWEQRSDIEKARLKKQQEQYGRDQLMGNIKALEGLIASGKDKRGQLASELEGLKKTLANMDMRVQEQDHALEKKQEETRPDKPLDQMQERMEYIKKQMNKGKDKDKGSNEPDKGPDRGR